MKKKLYRIITSEIMGLFCLSMLIGCSNNNSVQKEIPSVTEKSLLDNKSTEEAITTETDSLEQSEPIVWYEDLTHDGINEKIEVDLTYVLNYPETGEEQTVKVYSGSTGDLIWTGHADTVHPGWNGIYVYNDGNKDYLFIWQPTMYQGRATYSYQVFSLTERGDVQVLASENHEFDMNQANECDTNAISTYINKVNEYLENSYVLVDTDNGIPVYSTDDNKIINSYDISEVLNSIEEMKK